MKIRCGTDATTTSRITRAIERGGDRFVSRIFTLEESAYCSTRGKGRFASLAVRFAAKEAVAKALGTGIGAGVSFVDIEIARTPEGEPSVRLSGIARDRFDRILGRDISISLTHEGDLAMAFCVILCDECIEDPK
jgi:holo-[acyl-carrier protein] synthase